MAISLRSLVICAYTFMLMVGLIIPSDGNHGILSPKSLAFLAAFFSTFTYFIFKKRISMPELRLISFTLGALCFLFLWTLFGIISEANPSNSAYDQLKLFLITFTVAIITLYIIHEGLISPERILRTIIYGNFTYSLIKLSLIALHLLDLINIWSVLELMGIRFMSMLILQGIARLQTSVDIITPFLLFFVLQSESLNLHLGKKFKWIYAVVSIISIFLSFSRFLIMVGLFSYFFYLSTLKARHLTKKLLLFFFWSIGVLLFIGIENSAQIFEQRFLSSDNWMSDQTRLEQINSLLNEFYQSPYFGIGMGGAAKDIVRDYELQHSYEVQWVAFLMQFGFIGILFLLIPFAMIAKKFIFTSFSRIKLGFFLLFIIWIFSGFTNPFLISLTSGIVYSIFLAAGHILARDSKSLYDGKEEILFQNYPGNATQNKNRFASKACSLGEGK